MTKINNNMSQLMYHLNICNNYHNLESSGSIIKVICLQQMEVQGPLISHHNQEYQKKSVQTFQIYLKKS